MLSRSIALLALGAGLGVGCSAGGGNGGSASGGGSSSAAPGANGGGSMPDITIDPNADPDIGAGGGDGCDTKLPVLYRDFNELHPDFEMDFRGDVVRRQLVLPSLGADGKPAYQGSIGCPALLTTPLDCDNWAVSEPVITSAESFAQWYATTAGVNQEIEGEIVLAETAPGSASFAFESSTFFPLGPTEGFGITPQNYLNQNFLFTTEIHVLFKYTAGQTFAFRGDDDLWIFVNKKLAMDLGSLHGPAEGSIDFDAQAAALGIAPGGVYPMDIFHAERHTDGSNFKFTTNIACFTPSVVK